MKRRDFIRLAGGAAAAWPLSARAQQRALPVVGYLTTAPTRGPQFAAFLQGLKEQGFVEGQNVAIDYRSAENQYDRLAAMATDLVRRRVAVIAVSNGTAARAAQVATKTIPIVFSTGANPVEFGLVASLNRPGGNLTGSTGLSEELGPKRLQLLHEVVPAAKSIAVLINPTLPDTGLFESEMRPAAQTLGRQIQFLYASSERDFDTVFATLVQQRVGGLEIHTDPFLSSRVEQLAALTLRHAVPAIQGSRAFAVAGGLMGYATNPTESHRVVGLYTGRVLKGEKPADLPVQQATKVELIINLKTAKALGLAFPTALLVRADEVIE